MSQRIPLNLPFGNFNLTFEAPPTSNTKSIKQIFKPKKKEQNYLLMNPKKPHVNSRDGVLKPEDAIPGMQFLPEELKDKLTQEEYSTLVDTTFESCEGIYQQLSSQLDAPIKAINQLCSESEKMAYLPEIEKFKVLTTLIFSDIRELRKELNSIRALYTKYLNKDGSVKAEVNQEDAYILELVSDIKLRYLVCGNRIKNVLHPEVMHVSDFYTSMVIRFYHANPEGAPEDIKKFMQERLNQFIGTSFNAKEPIQPIKSTELNEEQQHD